MSLALRTIAISTDHADIICDHDDIIWEPDSSAGLSLHFLFWYAGEESHAENHCCDRIRENVEKIFKMKIEWLQECFRTIIKKFFLNYLFIKKIFYSSSKVFLMPFNFHSENFVLSLVVPTIFASKKKNQFFHGKIFVLLFKSAYGHIYVSLIFVWRITLTIKSSLKSEGGNS